MKHIENIIKIAEKLNISAVYDKKSKDIEFEIYSPEGQDFVFTIKAGKRLEDFRENLYEYYLAYDPDEEAKIWINGSGLENRGCPSSIEDLVNDMNWCKDKLYEFFTIVRYSLYFVGTDYASAVMNIAESLGVSAELNGDDLMVFAINTPAGQHYDFDIRKGSSLSEFIEEFGNYYYSYDHEKETLKRLNNPGLGNKDCPKSLADLIDDMRWVGNKIYELFKVLVYGEIYQ